MKRFYTLAEAASDGGILLDGRPVRTPRRNLLRLPNPGLAQAVAGEWAAQGEDILPATMTATGLANAAIDHVAPDPAAFAAGLARYAASDLLCYRAEGPAGLVARQAAAWDGPLEWARARHDVALTVTTGIVHVAQAPETLARLAAATAARDAFALAALAPLVTISGSLVLALAVAEGAMAAQAAFEAAMVDESWSAERWGEDTLAVQSRENRERDFLAAAGFLALL